MKKEHETQNESHVRSGAIVRCDRLTESVTFETPETFKAGVTHTDGREPIAGF